MFLKRTLFTIISLAALTAFAAADPGIPDTVRVPDVQANPGDHFPVEVLLTNDEALSGGTLGFTWGDPDLVLDSVSFVGSVLSSTPAGQRPVSIDNVNQTVLTGFFVIFDPPVPAGSGLWASLWFTADAGAPDKVIPIDSVKVEPSGDFVLIAQTGNESIKPQYVGGSVTLGTPSSNTPPTIADIGDETMSEGENLNVPVSASDAESTPTLEAVGVPTFGGFTDAGDGSGSFSFSPGFNDSGTYPMTVIASDGEFADTTGFTLTVMNVNRAPLWSPEEAHVVDEGAHLEFSVNAADPDTDPITLSLMSAPANVSLVDNGGGIGLVTVDPDFTQAGVYSIKLVATDGALADTLTVSLTIQDVNRAPAIAAIGDTTIDVAQALTIPVTASDPDGDSLVLTVDGQPATNASFTDNGDGTGLFMFTPDATQAGQMFNMIASASDGDSTAFENFSVTVNAAPADDTAWINADTLFFAAVVGGQAPDNQCPELWSTNAPAAYEITDIQGSPLFTVPTNTTGNTNQSLCIGVNPTDIPAGTYYNMVSITVEGVVNNPVTFIMCLTVTDAPIPDSAAVAPDTLFFAALEGSGATDSQCVTISSSNAPAAFTLVSIAGSPMVFTAPVNDAGTTNGVMCVVANTGELTAGTYYNTVTVDVADVVNSPVSFVTCLTVNEQQIAPEMMISDTLFTFATEYGAAVTPSGTVTISNVGGGEGFGWTVAKTFASHTDTLGVISDDTTGAIPAELTIGPLAGATPGSVDFALDNTALMPGEYYCTFTVTADQGVTNSPQMFSLAITVTMPVVDSSISVYFDLKPGSCSNPINNNGHGKSDKAVVPAAIIGTDDFDVSDIDISTLLLEGVAPVRSSIEDVTEPFDPGDSCACVETAPDGIDDLTLKFYRSELLAAAADIASESRTPLTLTGKLNDGTEFSAVDCFEVRPRGKGDGASSTPISQVSGEPDDFTLVGNYPNPFNPSTKIVIGVPTASHVTVEVYNLIGQRITSLHQGALESGYHTFEWDATDQASGVYLYYLKAGAHSESRKMVLLK